MKIRPLYPGIVVVVLLVAAASFLIARLINDVGSGTEKHAAVEIRRLVAVSDVPEEAYPPASGQNWFGGISVPTNREPGDVFILIETDGGRGEIEWSIDSSETQVFSGASLLFAQGDTRYLLVRAIANPDPICSPSARSFDLAIHARAQQTATERNALVHARWEGSCESGKIRFQNGSVPFNPGVSYSACIAGGRCRLVVGRHGI